MCNKQTREEAFTFIIDSLIESGDLTYNTNKQTKINEKTLLSALIQISVPLHKALTYSSVSGMSRGLRPIFSDNVLSKKTSQERWDNFLLSYFSLRYCSKCDSVLSFDTFYRSSSTFSGLQTYCIPCQNEMNAYNRDETLKHMVKVFIRENFLPHCNVCGYDVSWAAMEIHHKRYNTQKYPWTKNSSPSAYIFGVSPDTAEERFMLEKDNLQLICCNCHQNKHAFSSVDNQIGLKDSLVELGYKYACSITDCNEKTHLHLHHNNPKDKQYSFGDFITKSKQKILKDGFLELEMKKDVVILCGNHHREIHNPNKLIEKYK